MGPCPFRHGNHTIPLSTDHQVALLQWGHVLSDMVTSIEKGRFEGEVHGFNGAMSFQTW